MNVIDVKGGGEAGLLGSAYSRAVVSFQEEIWKLIRLGTNRG